MGKLLYLRVWNLSLCWHEYLLSASVCFYATKICVYFYGKFDSSFQRSSLRFSKDGSHAKWFSLRNLPYPSDCFVIPSLRSEDMLDFAMQFDVFPIASSCI